MSVSFLDSETKDFKVILGNGYRYTIPPFQRDYAWEKEQWEDLWNDILTIYREGASHYMGYIVLQKSSEKDEYKVIDGQQRLTTVSIIILATLKYIDNLVKDGSESEERLHVLRNMYVGSLDPISMNTKNKLTLNRNNKAHFNYLSSFLETSTVGKINHSNKLINEAFSYFSEQISNALREETKSGQKLAEFIELIASELWFTRIIVSDEMNAYTVFETLNARGVKLSTPDLLKNYLFSAITKEGNIPDNEIDSMDERWTDILNQLEKKDFSQFIRVYWNSQYELSTRNDLFKKIRKSISTREQAYKYLIALQQNAPVYAMILEHHNEAWRTEKDGQYKDVSRYLKTLDLFNIKQPLSILLSAYSKFNAGEFVQLCRYLTILSIRFNVICNKQANEQETPYNIIARKISSGEYTRASHVKNDSDFKKLYVSDAEFSSAFQTKVMPSRKTEKKIRYLLAEIESSLSSQRIDHENFSLEHILPFNPTEEWKKALGEDDAEEIIDRLGNMCLLTRKENEEAKRLPFSEKKKIYKLSSLKTTQKLAEYDDWDKSSIHKFQLWLAEAALNTWRIDYQ